MDCFRYVNTIQQSGNATHPAMFDMSLREATEKLTACYYYECVTPRKQYTHAFLIMKRMLDIMIY